MDVSAELPDGLVSALRSVQQMAVLTGSGVSAESGVPTFREAQIGLWSRFDPHELATPQAFRANPDLVWDWYDWRRKLVANAEPNKAHVALASLQRKLPHFTLITQNVDGLHQMAGSQDVLELHGNISRTICSSEGTLVEHWSQSEDGAPRCPVCHAYLRPDVVWFGEPLPAKALEASIEACGRCDLFLSVGTSALVQPAASLALLALDRGALVVEINIEQTALTPYADHSLLGKAGVILPLLASLVPDAG